MVIAVSGVSVYTYSHIPLDSLDWNEAQNNAKKLKYICSSWMGGVTWRGGSSENAVWNKNT